MPWIYYRFRSRSTTPKNSSSLAYLNCLIAHIIAVIIGTTINNMPTNLVNPVVSGIPKRIIPITIIKPSENKVLKITLVDAMSNHLLSFVA